MHAEAVQSAPAQLDPRLWGEPLRPWELEILTVGLLLAALCVPLVIQQQIPAAETNGSYEDGGMVGLVWVLGLIGAFAAYFAHQSTQVSYNSTPAGSLFAPIFFGSLCYLRAFYYAQSKGISLDLANGDPKQIVGYLLLLSGLVLFVARVRTLRRKLRYRKVNWDIEVPPTKDRTFITDLGRAILPLIFPPKMYRFCKDGILIEGFHYLYAVPFRAIESAGTVNQFSAMHDASYYARSSKTLIQLQLNDHLQPVLIGPTRKQEVLAYCQEQASERLVVAKKKVRTGR